MERFSQWKNTHPACFLACAVKTLHLAFCLWNSIRFLYLFMFRCTSDLYLEYCVIMFVTESVCSMLGYVTVHSFSHSSSASVLVGRNRFVSVVYSTLEDTSLAFWWTECSITSFPLTSTIKSRTLSTSNHAVCLYLAVACITADFFKVCFWLQLVLSWTLEWTKGVTF